MSRIAIRPAARRDINRHADYIGEQRRSRLDGRTRRQTLTFRNGLPIEGKCPSLQDEYAYNGGLLRRWMLNGRPSWVSSPAAPKQPGCSRDEAIVWKWHSWIAGSA